ncbi:Bug family tripartite tricarboxylate transporter substrate binding protein [Bosea lathyri]|uniref:Tripartite-type tricarboxylate transporter, receptor component TctC n=1 Tax=Bosea lathyri TaxID=1036778 RepID=A0A1H5SGX9_9HYPH|nr:tripartite tricarboxylate transporter substrate binding protein [Bosea lathyri]SEF49007.1 Tripartite-type tricarboxylate transporter, receptor component TctC [Bosea lathyri]
MVHNRIDRRVMLGGLGASCLGATLAAPVTSVAQGTWPQGRTLKLIVPFPPAGATDVLGRLVADKLGQTWGTNIVVENRPGAGGNIGTDVVAKAEPNGDTILIVSVGMATNQYLYPKLNYDPAKDLSPITMVALVPNLLVVSKQVPANNVAELIAYAKANPGKLTYGSSGVGTSVHLSGELFQKLTGTKMVHVPYRGTAQATQDLIGGRIDLIFDNITQALPHVRAGSIRGFGITTAKRSPTAAEFAPIAETVPGFDVSSWFALFAPAKTPQAVIDKIYGDTKAGIADPALRAKMDALAAEPVGNTPAELGAFLQTEMKKWGDLIREVGVKIE